MASHNNNSYRRMTGQLRLNGRSTVLETSDGSLFYLVTSEDLAAWDGSQVVVEGQLSGSNRLSLTWIGPITG
ncbi:MAG: hypothetical protein KGJ57_07600 [Sphingomonadales bacterium]|nr:hypothetical protein [Sphingomonadales bacterium]MDE2169277.1 hypothetical protein [Sphingomonadales bacterium]